MKGNCRSSRKCFSPISNGKFCFHESRSGAGSVKSVFVCWEFCYTELKLEEFNSFPWPVGDHQCCWANSLKKGNLAASGWKIACEFPDGSMGLPTYIIGSTFLTTRQGGEFYFSQNSVLISAVLFAYSGVSNIPIPGNNRQDKLQVELTVPGRKIKRGEKSVYTYYLTVSHLV